MAKVIPSGISTPVNIVRPTKSANKDTIMPIKAVSGSKTRVLSPTNILTK